MTGSIIPRGENTWLVRLFIGRDALGKRHYENRTVHGKKSDAQDVLDDLRRDKRRGSLTIDKTLTVGDLLDDVIRDYKINGQDYVWAELVMKRLRPTFAKMPVSGCGLKHVDKHIERRIEAKAAPATINHELSMLRRSFNLAVKKGSLSTVPLRIPKLKENNVRKGFF
jgi:hypothetical protein